LAKKNSLTPKQVGLRILIGLSVLGNIATIIALVILNDRSSDFYLTNVVLQRNCDRDLDYNLSLLPTEENKAFYSVSVCGGYNYKNKTHLTDEMKDMIKTVVDTK
jgi:hypothetical protein